MLGSRPNQGSGAMKVDLKTRLLRIVATPIMLVLSFILIFDLKRMEEEERQRELDL
jgi:hypothetical protein